MTHAFLGLELAYWQQTVIRLLAGLVAVLLLTGGVVYLYLFKFVSFMQSRLGPMEAGPFGSLQLPSFYRSLPPAVEGEAPPSR